MPFNDITGSPNALASPRQDNPVKVVNAKAVMTSTTSVRLRANELPRFHGKDEEDIDVWIEQVSAIYEASKCDEAELLRTIPLVSRDEARKRVI